MGRRSISFYFVKFLVNLLLFSECGATSSVSYEIEAAGRSALLGDIYDRVHEKFTASSFFAAPVNASGIVVIHGATPAITTFKIVHELAEKTSLVGLSTSLQTSSYLGLVNLEGSAAVTRKFSVRRNCITGLLTYKYTKGTHRLNYRNPYVQSMFVPSAAKDVDGTHVVLEIDYGTTIAIGFHFEATTSEDIKALEAVLTADMNSMVHSLDAQKAWTGESRNRLERVTFSAQVFGDSELGLNFVDNNITDIYKTLKKVPELLKMKNGSPIRYKLYSTDKFQALINGEDTSSSGSTDEKTGLGIQRIEEIVLSICYENEKNMDFYNEEMSRFLKHSELLPENYIKTAQEKFRRYTSAFKRRHVVLTRLVVSARQKYSYRLEKRTKRVAERFRRANHGPVKFNSYLTELSENITSKLLDFHVLTNGGFSYITKNSTSSSVALARPQSTIFVLFLSQELRKHHPHRHEKCLLSGIRVDGPKFVADCDILHLDRNCRNLQHTALFVFRDGIMSPENHCHADAPGIWETKQLSQILFKFPQ